MKDGEELAALAGAITALPDEPHRLDILLEDLAEAGIAVGPPYAIRPDAAAPVLAAAALDPGARVKIKLRPALQGTRPRGGPVPGFGSGTSWPWRAGHRAAS